MLKPTFDKVTKIWSGPKVTPIYNPDQNLGQLIVKVLEQTPDAVTQISADTGVLVTCGEMRKRVLKIAAHLSGLGLKQGDVVGVMGANSENLAPAVFACFLLGLPVNPLAPMMIESDVVQMYSRTKPKLIFCDSNKLPVVENAVNTMKSDARIITIMDKIDGYESLVEIIENVSTQKDLIVPHVDPNSTAFILCSSGSTGSPKGTCKSHKEIIAIFVPISIYNPNAPSVLYQMSAIFWISGFYFLIMGTLYKSPRVISAVPPTPQIMIDIMTKYEVTHMFTAPFAVVNILQVQNLKPFESVTSWTIAGAIVSKILCEKLKKLVPNAAISASYGCSEFNLFTTDCRGAKYGSCGETFENIELKIVDDNGNALDNNVQGEIYARREIPFLGYFGEPEKTAEAYDGEWFKTGDIGYFDEDGFIYVIDRKKELLKFNNYQVTPSELENIINEIDGVASSCVVGVLKANTGNDIIHAFVIVDEAKGLTESFIETFVNERVIDAKQLRGGVHFLKTFPLGLTGKVDRRKIKQIAEDMK